MYYYLVFLTTRASAPPARTAGTTTRLKTGESAMVGGSERGEDTFCGTSSGRGRLCPYSGCRVQSRKSIKFPIGGVRILKSNLWEILVFLA